MVDRGSIIGVVNVNSEQVGALMRDLTKSSNF